MLQVIRHKLQYLYKNNRSHDSSVLVLSKNVPFHKKVDKTGFEWKSMLFTFPHFNHFCCCSQSQTSHYKQFEHYFIVHWWPMYWFWKVSNSSFCAGQFSTVSAQTGLNWFLLIKMLDQTFLLPLIWWWGLLCWKTHGSRHRC